MNPLNKLIRRENKLRIKQRLEDLYPHLTPLQRKILKLTSEGLSPIEIADELNISHANIYSYIDGISQRLKKRKVYVEDFRELLAPVEDFVYNPRTRAETFPFERFKRGKCRLKEYFRECFGDDKTVCPICHKCKNTLTE